MSACACMGPPGNCPCIRRDRGEKIEITESFIAPELFSLLPDEDKETINRLKRKALRQILQKGRKTMFYEEKISDGVLWCRSSPTGEWMHKLLAPDLAMLLRDVAALWESDPQNVRFDNGICWAVKAVIGSVAYKIIDTLLSRLQDGWIANGDLIPYDRRPSSWEDRATMNWEDRATMCLLMAEWIETDGDNNER